MRRTMAFILALVLCLALCACSKAPKEPAPLPPIVGEWRTTGNYIITFNEDYTGSSSKGENFTWTYDEEQQIYTVIRKTGKQFTTSIQLDKGLRYLPIGNLRAYHKDDILKLKK